LSRWALRHVIALTRLGSKPPPPPPAPTRGKIFYKSLNVTIWCFEVGRDNIDH